MWAWSCTPPIRLEDVPLRYRTADLMHLSPGSWVYPSYERLAMGGTHSVHILMSINLHSIGQALIGDRTLLNAADVETEPVALEDTNTQAYT